MVGRCSVCNCGISDDVELIKIGLLKSVPICDKCSNNLEVIKSKNSTDLEFEKAQTYLKEKCDTTTNKKVGKYIHKYISKSVEDKNRKPEPSHGMIYYVDKLPYDPFYEKPTLGGRRVHVIIPKDICTCCTCLTDGRERVYANDEGYSGGFKTRYTISLEFPICDSCLNTRKRRSVKITSFSHDFASFGLMMTNKEYAEMIAELNDSRCSSFEDTGTGYISKMW